MEEATSDFTLLAPESIHLSTVQRNCAILNNVKTRTGPFMI